MKFIRTHLTGFLFLVIVSPIQAQQQPWESQQFARQQPWESPRPGTYVNAWVVPLMSEGVVKYVLSTTPPAKANGRPQQQPIRARLVCTATQVYSSKHGVYVENSCNLVPD